AAGTNGDERTIGVDDFLYHKRLSLPQRAKTKSQRRMINAERFQMAKIPLEFRWIETRVLRLFESEKKNRHDFKTNPEARARQAGKSHGSQDASQPDVTWWQRNEKFRFQLSHASE